MSNIVNENSVKGFDQKTAKKTVDELRVERKNGGLKENLTKLKQAFSFADTTGKAINKHLNTINTNINGKIYSLKFINKFADKYDPSWCDDDFDAVLYPRNISSLDDIKKIFEVNSSEHGTPNKVKDLVLVKTTVNYNDWFKDTTKLKNAIKTHTQYKKPETLEKSKPLEKMIGELSTHIAKETVPWNDLRMAITQMFSGKIL